MTGKRVPRPVPESLEAILSELKAMSISLFQLVIVFTSQHYIPGVRDDALRYMGRYMGLKDIISEYNTSRQADHDSLLKEYVALKQHLDHLEEENASLKTAASEKQEAISIRHVLIQCAEEVQNLSDDNRKTAESKDVAYTRQMIMKAAQTYKHCAEYLRDKAEDFKR